MAFHKKRAKAEVAAAGKTHRKIYCRERDLPGLIGIWPGDLGVDAHFRASRIIPLLRNALRIERQRGKSGHWSYNLSRHMALKRALNEELACVRAHHFRPAERPSRDMPCPRLLNAPQADYPEQPAAIAEA